MFTLKVMIMIIIQVLAAIVLLALIKYFAYRITMKEYPIWLEYQPYTCEKCLAFWTALVAFLTLGFQFQAWVFMISGITLAALDAYAKHKDEKEQLEI